MQNSCLVLPASFCCSMCTGRKNQNIISSDKQIMTAQEIQSFALNIPEVKSLVQEIIREGLELVLADWTQKSQFID